jgi:hypothetical protein
VDDDNVTEDQCKVCARWPKALREAMRFAILDLPLDEPVCLRCCDALAENRRWFQLPQAPMKH